MHPLPPHEQGENANHCTSNMNIVKIIMNQPQQQKQANKKLKIALFFFLIGIFILPTEFISDLSLDMVAHLPLMWNNYIVTSITYCS